MIRQIEIFGLFSSFDYKIILPENGEELIITGPNGYGKTTILTIIQSICSLDLLYFYSIPFKLIRVSYESHILDIVSFKTNESDSDDNPIEIQHKINFILIDSSTCQQLAILTTDKNKIKEAENEFDYQRNLAWLSSEESLEKSIESSSDLDKRQKRINILNLIARKQTSLGSFMIILRSLSVNAKFIPAQRMVSDSPQRNSQIQRVTDSIGEYLKKWYFDFLKNSQMHDAKFITRLMNETGRIDSADYESKIKKISAVISEANRFDLGGSFSIPEYNSDKSDILKSYIEDLEEKLSIYVEPLKELDIFHRLLGGKRFVGKRSVFSRARGLQFIADGDSSIIPIESLSSGEKNEIIMLYDFIFNLDNGSILMIDEPEISLHVAWQHVFLRDISEIARAKDLKVLVATHSPQIIGSRWNKCVDLFEQTQSSEVFS